MVVKNQKKIQKLFPDIQPDELLMIYGEELVIPPKKS